MCIASLFTSGFGILYLDSEFLGFGFLGFVFLDIGFVDLALVIFTPVVAECLEFRFQD